MQTQAQMAQRRHRRNALAAALRRRAGPLCRLVALALLLPASPPALAAERRSPPAGARSEERRPAPLQSFSGEAWRRVPARPGGDPLAVPPRAAVPRQGRRRCINIDNIATAQLFGDTAIELTLKGGRRWRLYLAQQCPALSFYQGFYYLQREAGQLCAGRDAIGARSGGECAIAAIVPAGKAPKG